MNRDEVLKILRENRQQLGNRFSIISLYLFGSVVRDEAQQGSDVVLLVKFAQLVGLFEFAELQQNLEFLLEGDRIK